MKVYIKNYYSKYIESKELSRILIYLNSNGKLLISEASVKRLYRIFSENNYRTEWKKVDDDVLVRFADWLAVTEF